MIGKNIYEIRKKRGLTLSELAERAKISKSYLSNIERHLNKNPSIQVIRRIAEVLGVDLKTLIKSDNSLDTTQMLDKEWFEFINDLKETGIKKDEISEYKRLLEFLQWKHDHQETN